MQVGDDVLIAGLGALAALLGAWMGARATRDASRASFDRMVEREERAWRAALQEECRLNIHYDAERSPAELWSYDTRVLRECSFHASAFPAEVLQRMIWARTADERLEARLEYLRPRKADPGIRGDEQAELAQLRERVRGELMEIEKALR